MHMSILLFVQLSIVMSATDRGIEWPDLPSSGFISGRYATPEDVENGDAAFSAVSDGVPKGTPIAIEIPQFAYHIDETGAKTPVIVIQAESAGGLDIVGARYFDESELVGTLPEFELLGKNPEN